MIEKLISLGRMWQFGLLAVSALCTIGLIAPFKLHVLLWLLTKVALAGYFGYWLDRCTFPYARPHEYLPQLTPMSPGIALVMLRRALIMVGFMLAVGLGAS